MNAASHRSARRLLSILCLLPLGAGVAACGEELGSCDEAALDNAAATLVLQTNCTSCHGSMVTGDGRRGAPAGLDFDSADIGDEAEAMWAEIDSDRMPPPAPAGAGPLGEQDRETLRNWLACGSRELAVAGCDPATEGEWTCLWAELGPKCVGCHAAATNAVGGNAVLGEAGDACGALDNLIDVAAQAGGACGGADSYVTAGDAQGSLLVQKLTGTAAGSPVCGSPMPLGQPALADSTVAADVELVTRLRAWIDGGATAPECQ